MVRRSKRRVTRGTKRLRRRVTKRGKRKTRKTRKTSRKGGGGRKKRVQTGGNNLVSGHVAMIPGAVFNVPHEWVTEDGVPVGIRIKEEHLNDILHAGHTPEGTQVIIIMSENGTHGYYFTRHDNAADGHIYLYPIAPLEQQQPPQPPQQAYEAPDEISLASQGPGTGLAPGAWGTRVPGWKPPGTDVVGRNAAGLQVTVNDRQQHIEKYRQRRAEEERLIIRQGQNEMTTTWKDESGGKINPDSPWVVYITEASPPTYLYYKVVRNAAGVDVVWVDWALPDEGVKKLILITSQDTSLLEWYNNIDDI